MREIKFRGKRKDNGQWVFGGYHQWITRQICPIGDNLKPEDIKDVIIIDSFADWNMPKSMQAVEILPETLGQYTGLKDKNGKEIYEGDIVSFEDAECDAEGYHDNVFLNRGVVSYDEVSMCYYFSNRQTVDMEDLYIPTDAEIIGNIYENPELLEEVKE